MANPDEIIGIGIELQLADLRKELATIPGLTADQAKLMVAELAKAAKASEKAAKSAAKAASDGAKGAAKEAKDAAAELKEAADDSGDAASQLGSALSEIAPEAGSVLQVISSLTDGFKGIATAATASGLPLASVARVTGVAAAAIGVAALAYRAASLEVERINRLRTQEAEIAASLEPAYRKLEDSQDQLAAAQGKLTAAGLEEIAVRREAQRAVLDYAKAQQQSRREALETIIANEGWANTQRNLARGMAIVAAYSTGMRYMAPKWAASVDDMFDSVTGFKSSVEDAKAQLIALDAAEIENAKTQGEIKRVTLEADKATRSRAAGAKKAAESLKLLNEAMAAENATARASHDAYQGALDALASMESSQRQSMGTAREKLDLDRTAALEAVDAERRKAMAVATSTTAIETLDQSSAQTRAAIEANYQAQAAKLQEEATKKHKEEIDKRRQDLARLATDMIANLSQAASIWDDLSSGMVTTLQKRLEENGAHMTASERKQLKAQIEEQKKGALVAFRISQQTAAAQAGVKAGLASMDAFQSAMAVVPYPANLVVAPVSAALVAATGLAEVAKIEAQPPPTFHTGLAPDEYTSKLRIDEGVITGQGVRTLGGRDAIRDANAGRTPVAGTAGTMRVEFNLDGRTVETMLYASQRRGGVLTKKGATMAGKSTIFRGN